MNSERRSRSSIVEVTPLRVPGEQYDVAILGGGLAGLSLAVQLKRVRPHTSVLVLEKREGLAPLAAFKVGESTVSAGAHYFAEVVGMLEHLRSEELIKCGLRFFLTANDNTDITARREKGPPDFPAHDNYQLDRGLFENSLAVRVRALGGEVAQAARVKEVQFGDSLHRVVFEHHGTEASTAARWVIDASGREALLKRQLGLEADSGHHINAAWLRLRGGLDIEDWGRENEAWMSAVARPGIRKFSTNHLLGEGYWVWLIPLSTGPISIGVCADPRFHPFEEISSLGRLLEWLRRYEPQLADAIESRVDDVDDFLRVEDFSYAVTQTYSTDRWSLVGEAAAFADPFFSPGSDFIGFGNVFTTDLVRRDLDGEDISERVEYFNQLYQRLFEHVISRYRDTYAIYGHPMIGFAMLNWDFYSTHSGPILLFVANKLDDPDFIRTVESDLDRLIRLNINMHKMFIRWNELQPADSVTAEQLAAAPGPPPGFGPPGGPPPGFPPGGPPPGFGPPGGPPQGFPPGGPPPGFPPGGPPPGFPPGGPPPGFPPGGPPPGLPPEMAARIHAVRLIEEVVNSLVKEYPDDDAIRAELHQQVVNAEEIALDVFRQAVRLALPDHQLPEDRPLNPYVVSLDPERWEKDGLFDAPAPSA